MDRHLEGILHNMQIIHKKKLIAIRQQMVNPHPHNNPIKPPQKSLPSNLTNKKISFAPLTTINKRMPTIWVRIS